MVKKGVITRDKSGDLYWYPKNFKKLQVWGINDYKSVKIDPLFNLKFNFINWEDKEVWSIEDLLKLEVEDNVE